MSTRDKNDAETSIKVFNNTSNKKAKVKDIRGGRMSEVGFGCTLIPFEVVKGKKRGTQYKVNNSTSVSNCSITLLMFTGSPGPG
ncbi:24290_t:CDS:2 [Gigaspora margarita]|uniref:24290_t:CDS:1 n=1 Tax=Gigaspora margarita TaxID=4874 RepID=A0ABN7VNS5_GIGMA|nr:24290_t:CDS:2 [Gigaspora margarita]